MRLGPLGVPELLIILVVVLLLFGAKRLPEIAKSMGSSVREFRKGIKDIKEDFSAEIETEGTETAKTKTQSQS